MGRANLPARRGEGFSELAFEIKGFTARIQPELDSSSHLEGSDHEGHEKHEEKRETAPSWSLPQEDGATSAAITSAVSTTVTNSPLMVASETRWTRSGSM